MKEVGIYLILVQIKKLNLVKQQKEYVIKLYIFLKDFVKIKRDFILMKLFVLDMI